MRNDNQNKITDKNDAENRLEYEKAKYLNHLETYKQSILQEVKSDLDLEILGIRNIIQYADQDLINKNGKKIKTNRNYYKQQNGMRTFRWQD